MDDPKDNRGPELVKLMIVFLVMAWISVLVRCYVRLYITRAFRADDWFMTFALGTFSLFAGLIFASVQFGLGRHEKSLDLDQKIKARMYYALSTVSYIACMAFVKLSIGLLMLRIVVARRYTYIIIACMAVVAVWSLADFLFVIFQCRPVKFQWDRTVEGKCTGDFMSAALAFSVMSILSDWFYALLPIPMLWPLQMSIQSKISIGLLLSLGIIASIGPLVRLKYLLNMKDYSDLLYSNTNALIWTIIEPGLSITTASIATFRPLLGIWRVPGFGRTVDATHGGSTSNGGPYPHFHNLGTLPAPANGSISRSTKSWANTQSGICEDNRSEDFILPPNKILKTVRVALVHDHDVSA